MKKLLFLFLTLFVAEARLVAQSGVPLPTATETIQQSQSGHAGTSPAKAEEVVEQAILKTETQGFIPIKIPAGTPIEVEVAYTVSSIHVKAGEQLSFRVLIPITLNGVVVIEKGALVTARVTVAKRGGRWGKAGRLSWTMQDVIAADNTRLPLAPETSVRNPDWILLKPKDKNNESPMGQGSVKGDSHKGEVALKTVVAAAIFPPLAPLALMNGFRRGENAILPEGKRFVVVTRTDSSVTPKTKP